MPKMTTFYCPECDHEHEIEIIRGEYPDQDYYDWPETCEACGEQIEEMFAGGGDDRQSERRQMGITY